MSQYIIKIHCGDEKGLLHKISGVLFQNGLNITENEEFVDKESNHFFQRSELTGIMQKDNVIEQLKATLPSDSNIEVMEKHKKDIVILVTKEYHCIGDLLMRHHFGELNANIKAVIGNHATLQELTEKFNIPFHLVSAENLDREEHELTVMQWVDQYDPEYLVLAKYMRILTPNFIGRYENRIVNIHHSFLPAFVGAKPYAQAHSRGVKMIGATAHFVNNDLDEGPIITQDVIQINHRMDAVSLARMGRDVEKIVLSNALKLVFYDRVFVHNNKTVILG